MTSLASSAAEGVRPARVVAVHRETAIVRDGSGDRPASVSGAFRFEALARSDFPAVGEWVVRAPHGTRLALSARADRAGVVRAEVILD